MEILQKAIYSNHLEKILLIT